MGPGSLFMSEGQGYPSVHSQGVGQGGPGGPAGGQGGQSGRGSSDKQGHPG